MVGPIKDGNFYIQQRKEHEGNLQKKKKVGSGLQIKEGYKNYSRSEQKKSPNAFDIPSGLDPGQMVMCETKTTDITGFNCGGPVIEKNTNELEELKTIQDAYNRELQEYNNSIKNLMENSKLYVHATNNSTNRAHNNWVRDEKTGSIGYVTSRGVYKELPDLAMGNEIQGNNKCPGNYTQTETVTVNSGQVQSLSSAPYNDIVETNMGPIIKGDPMISNQSCSSAGENIYITRPAKTTEPVYKGCNKTSGQIQTDLGETTFE